MAYLKRMINKLFPSKISLEDLAYLNELLKTNLPIKTCLSVLQNNRNRVLFDSLLSELNQGKMIEDIIERYLPKEISTYMRYLLKKLSFKESLNLSLSYYSRTKENSKSLEKAMAYPVLLLFVSLTALYLFDSYGLDSILNLMKSFDINIDTFNVLRVIMRIIIYIFYFAFIGVALIVLIMMNPKRITMFYIAVSKYLPNCLFQTYFTEDFISLFIITLNLGYKTKESLEILKGLKNKPIVSLLSYHLDDGLLEGKTLKEASNKEYYDEMLVKFINIASYSNNFIGILNNYVELARNKIKNKMKVYTTILQLSSYIIIGFVIVFIYQVLFLPMQAITSF